MKRRQRAPDLLGFHGLVFRTPDPVGLARRWQELTGLPVLHRSSREIVLGHGPELFVLFRRGDRDEGDRLEEAHLAVRKIADWRRDAEEDALGGSSWAREAGRVRVIAREFQRPPSRRWKKKRAKRSS